MQVVCTSYGSFPPGHFLSHGQASMKVKFALGNDSNVVGEYRTHIFCTQSRNALLIKLPTFAS